jgi:hypothetical protein
MNKGVQKSRLVIHCRSEINFQGEELNFVRCYTIKIIRCILLNTNFVKYIRINIHKTYVFYCMFYYIIVYIKNRIIINYNIVFHNKNRIVSYKRVQELLIKLTRDAEKDLPKIQIVPIMIIIIQRTVKSYFSHVLN